MKRSPSALACRFLAVILSALSTALFVDAAHPTPTLHMRAQRLEGARALTAGAPLEESINGGQSHRYTLSLERGQSLYTAVDPWGVDLAVTLSDPAGKKLAETSGSGDDGGPLLLSLIAEESGAYILEVSARSPSATKGGYRITLEGPHAASKRDRGRLAAFELLMSGRRRAEEGDLNLSAAKYEEARSAFSAAQDRFGEAVALQHLGSSLAALESLDKAVTRLNESVELWRELGDRRREAATLKALARAYDGIGEQEKAARALDQAVGLARALDDRRSEADLLFFGATELTTDQDQRTLDGLLQALAIYRDLGDKESEAFVLNSIGGFYFNLAEREAAANYFSQTAAALAALGDRRTEAFVLRNVGQALKEAGQYVQALDYMGRALGFFRDAIPHQHATTLTLIGEVYELMGEREKALEHYNQALAIRNEIKHPAQPVAYPRLLLDFARLHGQRGERDRALEFLGETLARIPDNPYANQRAMYMREAGVLYNSLGEGRKAVELFRESLGIDRSIAAKGSEAETLAALARAERDMGQLAEAREHVEAASRIAESHRARYDDYHLRAAYTASVQRYYELLIDVLMRLDVKSPDSGSAAAAFEASERKRARSLLDLLAEGRIEVRGGADPELRARERRLGQRLNASAARQSELLSGKHTPEQASAVTSEISLLTSEYQQTQADIRRKSPRYAALTQPAPLTLKELQRDVLDEETLLLEYALGDEQSYLWAVTRDAVKAYELPKRAEIEAEARRVYELLTARNRRRPGESVAQRQAEVARADRDYEEAASRLGKTVLGPVLPLMGSRRLLVVADGALQYVPFAALPKPGAAAPGLLVVEHEVVSLPSASVLAVMRHETQGRKPAPRTVAVLADPVFDASDPRIKSPAGGRLTAKDAPDSTSGRERALRAFGLADERGTLSRLPFTREEADSIMSAVPAGEGMKALDFKASREAATAAELARYRVLHFATHGVLNTEQPALSGLAFSLFDEKGRPRDGFLRLHEVYNLNLPAELVVLSACQTALGRDVRGEGLLGLTRGFMYAGTRRVAASLWKVNDSATAEMMGHFYREMLGKGKSPAAALRAAQLEMLRRKPSQAPYFWAAFVLQGEYR
jgi:CHAT domain-containing protein